MEANKQVVLGNGVLGQSVARLLVRGGRCPLVLSRRGDVTGNWATARCDASDPAQLAAHLERPATLYLCAAPPYMRWRDEFPRLADGIARACSGRRVDLVLADNLYAYGESATPFDERSVCRPRSNKGRIRHALAQRLMSLHGDQGVRVAIVRAADFFGPGVGQSSVGAMVVGSALAGKPTYLLGNPDLPHAITYVEDFARTLLAVAADAAAFGATWHAPSHNLASTRGLVAMLARHAGREVAIRPVGPWMMRMFGLFNRDMRELLEMRYLFEQPLAIAFEATARRFNLAATPLDQAVAATVAAAHRS